MRMKMVDICDLIPYEKNPRNNTKAVNQVAKSIETFGFKVPLVIDKNNVIVCGHTRYKALKKLNYTNVPCVIADDLTDDELKAFRLADNKVSEKASWDFELLEGELFDLENLFDMSEFGFDFDVSAKRAENKHQEMKTVRAYNGLYYDEQRTEGKYGMPTLHPVSVGGVDRWIGFNYAKTSTEYDCGIHFYLDDYQFERVWTNPEKYINILGNFRAVMAPTYSLYTDMPRPVQIYNVFRSRLLGQIMQDAGVLVVPIAYWGYEDSYEFCFDGLPENSVLSTYIVGLNKDKERCEMFCKGMDELIKRKHPKEILLYGNVNKPIDYDFGKIKVTYVQNEVTARMSSIKG